MIGQGDPVKIAKGKKTITNAVIGLIIVMSSSILSGAISGIVSGAAKNRTAFFKELFNEVFLWSGIVAVIMIVYGGIQYVTSNGNPQRTAKAKNTILYAAVGLLIVIFASAIVSTVINGI
jgi:cytochrome bd-type quinol oxidase subunit 2